MQTTQRSTLAVAVLTAFLASANAQTTTGQATILLPPEVIAARTQVFENLVTFVCNDVLAVKAAAAAFDADKAAGLSVTADAAAVQVAKMQLLLDQQQLAGAARTFLNLSRMVSKTDPSQLKADVTVALNSASIAADKAAVDAAEVKVKTVIAANDPATLATARAALDAARRQLATNRMAALASSLAVAADKEVLASRQALD
jgi:hypothetical protein